MNWSAWAFWMGGGVLGTGGMSLLLWALFADRARGRRRCPTCWYDMAGVPGLTCPECGRTARRERRLGRTRRRWRQAAIASFCTGIGAGLAATPNIRQGGWTTLVPTSVMLQFMSYFDEDAKKSFDGVVSRNSVGTIWTSTYLRSLPKPSVPPGLSQWDRLLLARRCVTLLEGAGSRTREQVLLPYGRGNPTDWGGVALILSMLGPEQRLVLPTLTLRVNDPGLPDEVRLSDLQLLERACAASVNFDRTCAMVVNDPSAGVRRYLLSQITNGPPTTVVPVLVRVLHDQDPLIRRYAADGLWRIGPEARRAIDELRAVAMDDPDRTVQMAASAVLSKIRRGPAP